ncbi:MAG: type II toxin-antitoxin system ParD family antitoxin [Pseudomonadales bacterium]
MATTSLSLGAHWEEFIRQEVTSGRYASASEVIRDALRGMESRKQKMAALKKHLAEGEEQALRGEFREEFSMDEFIREQDESQADQKSKSRPRLHR